MVVRLKNAPQKFFLRKAVCRKQLFCSVAFIMMSAGVHLRLQEILTDTMQMKVNEQIRKNQFSGPVADPGSFSFSCGVVIASCGHSQIKDSCADCVEVNDLLL